MAQSQARFTSQLDRKHPESILGNGSAPDPNCGVHRRVPARARVGTNKGGESSILDTPALYV